MNVFDHQRAQELQSRIDAERAMRFADLQKRQARQAGSQNSERSSERGPKGHDCYRCVKLGQKPLPAIDHCAGCREPMCKLHIDYEGHMLEPSDRSAYFDLLVGWATRFGYDEPEFRATAAEKIGTWGVARYADVCYECAVKLVHRDVERKLKLYDEAVLRWCEEFDTAYTQHNLRIVASLSTVDRSAIYHGVGGHNSNWSPLKSDLDWICEPMRQRIELGWSLVCSRLPPRGDQVKGKPWAARIERRVTSGVIWRVHTAKFTILDSWYPFFELDVKDTRGLPVDKRMAKRVGDSPFNLADGYFVNNKGERTQMPVRWTSKSKIDLPAGAMIAVKNPKKRFKLRHTASLGHYHDVYHYTQNGFDLTTPKRPPIQVIRRIIVEVVNQIPGM